MVEAKGDRLRSIAGEIIENNIRGQLFITAVKNTGLAVTTIPVEIEGEKYKVDMLEQSISVIEPTGKESDIIDIMDCYKDIKKILNTAHDYLNRQPPPAWNTLEKSVEAVNFLDEAFGDGNDYLYCVCDYVDSDSYPDIYRIRRESFRQAASIYLDILQWDGNDKDVFRISQKLGNIIDEGVKLFTINKLAGIIKHLDINKSVLPIINDNSKTPKIIEATKDAYFHTLGYVKQRISVVKSKYTKNGKGIPNEMKGSFEINGLKCDWELSHTNYYLGVSFSFSKETLDRIIKERGVEGIRNKIQFFLGTESGVKDFCCLLKKDISYTSWEWKQKVSVIYALSFASGSKNEIDIDGARDIVDKIFSAIREQIDKQIVALLNNLEEKHVKKNSVRMSNTEITMLMSELNTKIITHTETYGNAKSNSNNKYSHRFLLPDNFVVDGNRMHVVVGKHLYEKAIDIKVEIKLPDAEPAKLAPTLRLPIKTSMLTSKSNPYSGSFYGKQGEVTKKVMSLIIANVNQFIEHLMTETEKHIAENRAKIEQAEEILYNDFPEECMDAHLTKSI
jgi:hypothetical protein